ncbi:uncharacterized protein E0L32_007826 [Thyridium curvatum]|uniref:DUF726 domain protein n=1 Tax=Thyridium curvatum TaxID=1093900 RepID=A0A507AV92_9PEZI|nr:uncharacterized protein E0L32_007826 [Thyridium curvatum]TPX11407.1 hypothetical protein E0L32_007826 [Thyridium curvatum]
MAGATGTENSEQSSEKNEGPGVASPAAVKAAPVAKPPTATVELDDFGLPIRKYTPPETTASDDEVPRKSTADDRKSKPATDTKKEVAERRNSKGLTVATSAAENKEAARDSDSDQFEDAVSKPPSGAASADEDEPRTPMPPKTAENKTGPNGSVAEKDVAPGKHDGKTVTGAEGPHAQDDTAQPPHEDLAKQHARGISVSTTGTNVGVSEFSHQQTMAAKEEHEDKDDGWQTMPAYAPYDIYDDDNKLIAKEHNEEEDEKYGYAGLGGAGKGYTRVLVDDDGDSVTSLDDNTKYLFKNPGGGTSALDDDDAQRDAVSQLQATKDLLTEGQRIAYVGLTRLELSQMLKDAETMEPTKKTKKQIQMAAESMRMWSQKMMIRLYSHMDISAAEQVMIEQLSEHGVMPKDLTPLLMANARVKNPMAEQESPTGLDKVSRPSSTASPRPSSVASPRQSSASLPRSGQETPAEPPPPYQAHDIEEMPDVQTPSQLPTTEKIDIDLRWTVLCDLFLVLIADSIYDARSRTLFEKVGRSLEIWELDVCRFEKKVTDALEMQQAAEKENWNEDEHMQHRQKMALKRRYVMMGLATVGGGLVIGLSAGLLAPVIGAGLAAGFTTIGVTGTSSFLAGAGGAAIITSSAAASGSIIGVRAANRRTGAVRTFEYRPLHNNKRVNLIVTVSGWMTGKVDDVRLPFSTVDPVMGDIYSVLWEPEMLTSMGDTINILATEALTQGLQQVLGSTILISLMAALQLPVVLTKLSYLIDNPWAVSLDRATMAGLILADSLIDRNLGTRPITLVGYSLGSRVIFSCLQELARKGAFGIIQNVFIFGSPIVVKKDEYLAVRTVVSGRFVNGYNRNDWILGYLFRLTNGGIRRVAGLAPVEGIPGMENMDVTEFVVGHMDYRTAMPRLLRESGWIVESDEFTEIEDPDPDNHTERQRELINEIEEARKELEKEGKGKSGGAFGFLRRKKKTEKQEWEVYEDSSKAADASGSGRTEDKLGNNHGVLFDVDAIRAELAREGPELEVKELQSTLPPMKLDLTPTPSPVFTPRDSFRETKSAENVLPIRSSHEYRLPEERTPTKNSYPDVDDGISMTFDTSFDDSPRPAAAASATTASRQMSEPPSSSTTTSRPEMKTAQTMPNVGYNPWGDDPEDDDFGKEKEISMTFA